MSSENNNQINNISSSLKNEKLEKTTKDKKNSHLIIVKKILEGGVLSELNINSKIGETKQSFFKYLDEVRDCYKNKIKKIVEQEKKLRQEERELRSENRPRYEIQTLKQEKNKLNEKKKRLILVRRREVYDLKRFIKTGDIKEYMKPRHVNKDDIDEIRFSLYESSMKGVAKVYRSKGPHHMSVGEFFIRAEDSIFRLIK